MKKVLVTGASGQLGMTLRELAHDYAQLQFDFRTSKELDITNTEQLEATFSDGYDYCLNCAAYTNVEGAEKYPGKAFKVNAEGVLNLALWCEKNEVVLIHISTDYVFDGEKSAPYRPYDTPNPINVYGKSKLQGELYVQQTLSRYYIVRTSWLYSKNYGKNFYKTILAKANAEEELNVTDGQIGCPTNTLSLSQYLIKEFILGEKEFGIYHFSDGEAMTWYDFAKTIIEEHGLEKKVRLRATPSFQTLAKRPKNSVIMS